MVFQERRKSGRLDLEATEMAVRAALQRAGAAALSQLLQFPAPTDELRTVACSCGQSAHYHSLRSKPLLTAVGWAQVSRPYYWCPTCQAGQFPADREVDLYHARQHLWEVARSWYPNDEGKRKGWMKFHQKRLLDKGKIEKLVAALRSIKSSNPEVAEKLRTEADYFERNAERMRYPKFRRQHLFVGSGVIEAGCKTVIASRFKRSGMFWTVRGANAILALRCCHLNGRFHRITGRADAQLRPLNPNFYVAHPLSA